MHVQVLFGKNTYSHVINSQSFFSLYYVLYFMSIIIYNNSLPIVVTSCSCKCIIMVEREGNWSTFKIVAEDVR